MRVGRGGRILLDRRDTVSRRITPKLPRSSLFSLPEDDEDKNMDVDDPEEAERLRRLEEQWRFDADDVPPVGPEGADEQNRIMVDDYDPKYVYHLYSSFPAESDKPFQLLETYHDIVH
jgi:enhancer of polycomb-like protein